MQKKLLAWYAVNARDLPWRRTKDPYAIWVSEIMLQQTQVQTVTPYYERWLNRFPTLAALADAPLDEVLKYWAGLGYYRRVKMLHEAARFIQSGCGGKIPSDPDELVKIPGIGRYTAGAIASIAFQEPVPLVDGNVIRVLTRLYGIKDDIGQTKTQRKLWVLAESLVPKKKPGDFNQALMELGATVCLPANPACLLCPVSAECKARAKGRPEDFPVKAKKEKLEKLNTAALILKNKQNQVFIEKQPQAGRWGGLWMFPFAEEIRQLEKRFGVSLKKEKPRLKVRHGFTKYQISLSVYQTKTSLPPSTFRLQPQHKWVALHDLPHFAFPSPHQKIVKELLSHA